MNDDTSPHHEIHAQMESSAIHTFMYFLVLRIPRR
jgi:hypothetical protein